MQNQTITMKTVVELVSLIHRRDEYRGAESSVQTIKSFAESNRINLYENSKISGFEVNADNSFKLAIDADGDELSLNGDVLLVLWIISKVGTDSRLGFGYHPKICGAWTDRILSNEYARNLCHWRHF